jgi:hypothetical protein
MGRVTIPATFGLKADDAAFGIVARRARYEVIDLGRDVVRYGLEQSDARPKVSLSNMTLMCCGLRPIAVPPPKARYVRTRGKTHRGRQTSGLSR